MFQTKVMIVPTRTRIILWPGKTNGDSPGIFHKRSTFKCSDSEHNSNHDSRFSRGKLPTPESIESQILSENQQKTQTKPDLCTKFPYRTRVPLGQVPGKLCRLRLWIVPRFGEHRNWNQELQLLLRIRRRGSATDPALAALGMWEESLEKALLVPLLTWL